MMCLKPVLLDRKNTTRLGVLTVMFLLLVAGNSLGDVQYAITDLGTLGGEYSQAYGINNNGQIVGWAEDNNNGGYPFLYTGAGPMQQIPDSVGEYALGINDAGQVVGGAYYRCDTGWYQWQSSGGGGHAFIYDSSNGVSQDIGTLPGGNRGGAHSINNSGQVVGEARVGSGFTQSHAFQYGGGVMQDLGVLGGSASSSSGAYGINDSGQIVGENGNGRAFLSSGGVVRDLGTLGGTWSSAFGINKAGQITGWANLSNYSSHAFLYSGNGPMQDLGTLPGSDYSWGWSVNNRGQVVGACHLAGQDYPNIHAFVYSSSSGMQDLNNLIPASSGLTVEEATAINDKGQIVGWTTSRHAFLLSPLNPASRPYPTPPPVCTPGATDRLAKWNGTGWDTVSAGSVSGKVHVLVHGWAPGELDWVKGHGDSSAKVWNDTAYFGDPNAPELGTFAKLAMEMAAATGDTVLAYSWIDQSATIDRFGLPLPADAAESQRYTTTQGGILADQLKAAIGQNPSNLQLIGHSHGAKVAAMATQQLDKSGPFVNHLTLFDSPDSSLVPSSAKNDLDSILASMSLGTSTCTTFVDNYYSLLGRKYQGNVVNVQLDGPSDLVTIHGYPIDWYTKSITETSLNTGHVGIDWSPLTSWGGKDLSNSQWEQRWLTYAGGGLPVHDPSLELNLVPEGGPVALLSTASLALTTVNADSHVTDLFGNRKLFTKASPAFWDSTFTKNDGDVGIRFTYEFIQPGEGDQLGVWVDDELKFVVTGEFAGTGLQVGSFDISDFSLGLHVMTVALHDYGTAPAQFSIGDFQVVSVPEPSTLALLLIASLALGGIAFRRQKCRQA